MVILVENPILSINNSSTANMEQVHSALVSVTEKPDYFLSVNKDAIETIKSATKQLYDYLKTVNSIKYKNVVPRLFLDGMDEEQIWHQIDLHNDKSITDFVEKTSNLLAMKDDAMKIQYTTENNDVNESNSEPEEDMDEESEQESDNEIGQDDDGDEEEEGVEEEQQTGDEEEDENDDNEDGPKKNTGELDDEFFKIKELKRFLDEEDRKEMKKLSRKGKSDNSDDDIDLFQDLDSDDENEDQARDMKYGDFFEKPESKKKQKHFSDEDEEEEDDENNESRERRVKFDLSKNEEFEIQGKENDEEDGEEEEEAEDENDKSTFEDRQDRLKKKIERMEKKALGDKPWQLKGEITASSRPENSLLEEILEFDSATRPAPLITEETTKRLDDIILQRIKDKAFDDVERKIKPTDGPNEFRKRLILDETKSKESLSQIYEKEYLDKVEALKDKDNVLEEEPKIKKEIKEMMKQLFSKLDALTNYHFTPKPAAPEIKIITNTPAIEMEEPVPVAISDANLLAPEEVKARPKGDILGESERTKTDKNRERRHKKLHQKIKFDKQTTSETNSGKMKKTELAKVTKSRNVQKMKEDGFEVKSSKQFFHKLQDEVTNTSSKKPSTKRKKEMSGQDAKKFKL